MSPENGAQVLWGIGALVLALSALMARRPSRSTIARSLLAWMLIGALIFLVVVGVKHFRGTAETTRQVSPSGDASPRQFT